MKQPTASDNPDEYEYTTSDEGNRAILREISKIRFKERLIQIMPLIARSLADASVDFSRVDFAKLKPVTDVEIDAVYEDLF